MQNVPDTGESHNHVRCQKFGEERASVANSSQGVLRMAPHHVFRSALNGWLGCSGSALGY